MKVIVLTRGRPLSPLLSNVMLHELDKELEKRDYRFCRYADDCNIYVKSKKSGKRVMDSISQFIEKRLELKVNRDKSAVDHLTNRKFLGFSFYCKEGVTRIRVHPKSLKRLKAKLKELTGRSVGMSMEARVNKLNQTIQGWVYYYKLANMRNHCQTTDEWLRRRLRMCPILACSLTNDHFRIIDLSCLSEVYSGSLSLRTAVCRTAGTVV